MSTEKVTPDPALQLYYAKSIFNGIWDLLEKADRSPAEDEQMLLRAFASLYHWTQVGTALHIQRGYWMISRVYQTLRDAHQALEWAKKCQVITDQNMTDMEDFDLAFAQEGLARAFALNAVLDQARVHYQKAVELGKAIQDPEDRKHFQNDLKGGEWYQLEVQDR
jgi:hypothetical protein